MHALLKQHGAQVMQAAFEHALHERTFGAEYIAHYVTQNGSAPSTDQQELPL